MDNKRNAVEEAVRMVMEAVGEADGKAMVGRRAPKPGMEAMPEGGEPPRCEACEAGECMDPEHASEDDLSAMMEG